MVGAVGHHAMDSPCSRVLTKLRNYSERKRPAHFVCHGSDGCGSSRTAEYSSDGLDIHMLRRICGQRSPETRRIVIERRMRLVQVWLVMITNLLKMRRWSQSFAMDRV